MALWQRSKIIKVAFLLCVLLVLLFQSSTFRSRIDKNPYLMNLTIRFPSDAISNSMSLMRPNFKHTPANTNSSHSLSQLEISNITESSELVQHSNSAISLEPNTTIDNTNAFLETKSKGSNDTSKPERNTKIQFIQSLMNTFGLISCPLKPPNLIGPIDVDTKLEALEAIETKFKGRLLDGGWYKPSDCTARDRVAIIVPYRDRADQLPIFLKNIHPFLMKQQIEYGIFIIEQTAAHAFNRASLLNVGFKEALKLHQWDCLIFHDVDLLPLDDRNMYTCPEQPRHMSVAVDTFGFRLPYYGIFGGACAMTVKQFQTVNGFSNSFWGWGGEDDDMSNRLRYFGFHISRYPYNIARYKMLHHRKDKASPNRFEKLKRGMAEFTTEGLNSLKYEVKSIEKKVLYTRILVELKTDTLINALAAFFTKFK